MTDTDGCSKGRPEFSGGPEREEDVNGRRSTRRRPDGRNGRFRTWCKGKRKLGRTSLQGREEKRQTPLRPRTDQRPGTTCTPGPQTDPHSESRRETRDPLIRSVHWSDTDERGVILPLLLPWERNTRSLLMYSIHTSHVSSHNCTSSLLMYLQTVIIPTPPTKEKDVEKG